MKSKKLLQQNAVEYDPFLFHSKFSIQAHTRISILKQCLSLLSTEVFKTTPLVLVFTDLNLQIKRKKAAKPAKLLQHSQFFLKQFLETPQPVFYLVNKSPVSFNGCKKSNPRRKKKHLVRMRKFNGPY